jgi:hypothetical protein
VILAKERNLMGLFNKKNTNDEVVARPVVKQAPIESSIWLPKSEEEVSGAPITAEVETSINTDYIEKVKKEYLEIPKMKLEDILAQTQKKGFSAASKIENVEPIAKEIPFTKSQQEILDLGERADEMLPQIHKTTENRSQNDSKEFTKAPEDVIEEKIPKIVPEEPKISFSIEPISIKPKVTQKQIEEELEEGELERSKIVTPKFVHKNNGGLPELEEIVIGRKDEFANYVIPDNKKVSSCHLKIYKENEKWFVEDENSTNGTRLNGAKLPPLTPMELKYGDVISFVGETIIYENGEK